MWKWVWAFTRRRGRQERLESSTLWSCEPTVRSKSEHCPAARNIIIAKFICLYTCYIVLRLSFVKVCCQMEFWCHHLSAMPIRERILWNWRTSSYILHGFGSMNLFERQKVEDAPKLNKTLPRRFRNRKFWKIASTRVAKITSSKLKWALIIILALQTSKNHRKSAFWNEKTRFFFWNVWRCQ